MELSDILHNLKIQELTPMQEAAKEAYQSAVHLSAAHPCAEGKACHKQGIGPCLLRKIIVDGDRDVGGGYASTPLGRAPVDGTFGHTVGHSP